LGDIVKVVNLAVLADALIVVPALIVVVVHVDVVLFVAAHLALSSVRRDAKG
jgi:hypothetical protein